MIENLIHFESMEWETPSVGVKQKVFSVGDERMRLLQFHDNFVEENWCMAGHVGFVLEGEMTIDFNGTLKSYEKGAGLWIKAGADSKHKVKIEKGKYIELILFESIK